jgi:prephenate dehydrogenase
LEFMAKPRIAIIGLGRIGGSIGLALKKANAELEIVGHDKNSRTAQQAQRRGAVDKTDWNLLNTCQGAGMVVLALPLGEIRNTLSVLSKDLPPGTIVTDTASSKAPVLEWAQVLPPGVHFVGGDPIIPPTRPDNPDVTGIDASDAGLFQDAVYCLTPTPTDDPDAVEVMSSFVALLGAKPLFLDAQEHDGLIAGAQHLAYILSATLLQATTASGGWREMRKFAGRDYLTATELAARDPLSQRVMVLHHGDDLIRWIDNSIQTLKELRAAIARGDAEALDALFNRMVEARAEWLKGDVGAGPGIELADFRSGAMRMLVGGLADRGGKKK